MNGEEAKREIICPACKVPCQGKEIAHVKRYICPKCGEVYALLDGEPVPAREH